MGTQTEGFISQQSILFGSECHTSDVEKCQLQF